MSRAGRKVALVAATPEGDDASAAFDWPNHGIRRIQAALVGAPELGAEVQLVETRAARLTREGVEALAQRVAAVEPDVIGLSAFVWSFPALVEVARRAAELLPDATIVFGGPSARPSMFELPPYRDAGEFVDAIVIREGEETFRELMALEERDRAHLARVPGLAVPASNGSEALWQLAPERAPIGSLDEIASPYQLGLMRRRSMAYLETYRGCPLTCTFCEWGIKEDARRVFSVEYLVRELEACLQLDAPGAVLLDAGLNLNARAFQNLAEAERRVGFLTGRVLICEVYPSHLSGAQIEFLSKMRAAYVGIGLQSFEPEVLARLERPFDEARFLRVVEELGSILPLEVQVILGLPGDSPRGFRRTLERALELPASVRVYHCLVLPDALLTRGHPSFAMRFRHDDLKMIECLGWSAAELSETADWVTALAESGRGVKGDYWWAISGGRGVHRIEYPIQVGDVPLRTKP